MKSAVKLTLDDRDLKRRLKKVEYAVGSQAVYKGLRTAEFFLIGKIQIYLTEKSELNVDSGNLRASITEEDLSITKRKSYVTFGPHAVYAAIHEFGGVIVPTNGPYLVFTGSDGNLVFTKSVTIPARPYLRPAIDESGDEALSLLGKTIGEELDRNWS